jgi:hypothetical protein
MQVHTGENPVLPSMAPELEAALSPLGYLRFMISIFFPLAGSVPRNIIILVAK